MMAEENNVITLNGKEYDSSNLTDQQTYWTAQIQSLSEGKEEEKVASIN